MTATEQLILQRLDTIQMQLSTLIAPTARLEGAQLGRMTREERLASNKTALAKGREMLRVQGGRK